MIKRLVASAAVVLPLAAFAAGGSQINAPAAKTEKPTGNTAVDGTKHRSDKKTLKAYCEQQAARQKLDKQKTQAAIAACEKS